jgi:Flp pilus assembly protein TadG
MNRRRSRHTRRDRGAVAVEFAILLPVLLLILFGIIDFGRALNAQIALTQAAREGARLDALNQPNLVTRTQAAAAGLGTAVSVNSTLPPGGYQCQPGDGSKNLDAKVQTSYSFSFITPVGAVAAMFGGSGFGSPITLTAQGVMPCET